MRVETVPLCVCAVSTNSLSRLVVTEMLVARFTMVRPGCVVVLAFAVSGAQTPPPARLHAAGAEPTPQSASTVHELLHAPLTQLPAMPPAAVHCESIAHWPFWN